MASQFGAKVEFPISLSAEITNERRNMKTNVLVTSVLLGLGLSAASAGQPDPRFYGVWVGFESYGGRIYIQGAGPSTKMAAEIGIGNSGKTFAVGQGLGEGRYEVFSFLGQEHVGVRSTVRTFFVRRQDDLPWTDSLQTSVVNRRNYSHRNCGRSSTGRAQFGLQHKRYVSPEREDFTREKEMSGQRESNPHGQLGRLELYH